MAQLRSYFSLCPLIDRKSFLGVTEDKESGCGIVTLGRNVITRYKFSDQKQIGGWSSKDHITAPVIYDAANVRYVGVFNENMIKVWNASVASLDGLKKSKFCKPILKVVNDSEGAAVIIFKDGGCADLSYGILAKKNLETVDLLQNDESIVDVVIFTLNEKKYIGYILKQGVDDYSIVTCELNVDINTLALETLKRVQVKREELVGGRLVGITISGRVEPAQAHILWSDGRLFSNILLEDNFTMVGHVPRLCCDVDVSLSWMGDNHLALYGADSSQEGAVLAVFNVLFGVSSCSHPLKLFCKGARLWCLREHILLEATQHLAVVPFILSSDRNTLSLIGSHKTDKSSEKVLMADWGKGKIQWKPKEKWEELARHGISEREICTRYLPKLLDKDCNTIKTALKTFTDVPENIIVTLIAYVIKHLNTGLSLDICNEEFSLVLSDKLEWNDLLNSLLGLPYVKENIIPYLRKNFDLENTLFLLRYINYLLEDTSTETNFTLEYEQKVITWSTILLDAHYQQLVLSSEAKTFDILTRLNTTVDNLISQIDEVEVALPIVQSLCAGKDIDDNLNIDDDSTYYIEEVQLHF